MSRFFKILSTTGLMCWLSQKRGIQIVVVLLPLQVIRVREYIVLIEEAEAFSLLSRRYFL